MCIAPICRRSLALVGAVLAVFALATPPVFAADENSSTSTGELTAIKAVVLGLVEGVTEYLPVSSTGHLIVAERMMNLGDTRDNKALDSYTVIIQAGAILAVVVLYRQRIVSILRGLFGRDPSGRQLLVALIAAFLPAAIIGKTVKETIEDRLLEVGPVVAAWIVGGVVILLIAQRYRAAAVAGKTLEFMTWKHGLIIGCAQALALWPGVSRSLVTILGAVLIGYSLAAALEFSFLLGLATLSAATILELVTNGSELKATYGVTNPLIGVVVAGVSAFIAVKWMVGYLQRHDLKVFGYYRIAIGIIVAGLAAAGAF